MMLVNTVLALGPTARLTPSAYHTITDITASISIQTWSMNDVYAVRQGQCQKTITSRMAACRIGGKWGNLPLPLFEGGPASDGISSASSSCSASSDERWQWNHIGHGARSAQSSAKYNIFFVHIICIYKYHIIWDHCCIHPTPRKLILYSIKPFFWYSFVSTVHHPKSSFQGDSNYSVPPRGVRGNGLPGAKWTMSFGYQCDSHTL